MKNTYIQIFTTFPRKSDAEKIAKRLINEKLAGCVQVFGPIKSFYRWKGKVNIAREWLCVVKTTAIKYKRVEKAIKKIHSYSTPEIIFVPIVGGDPGYLSWLNKQLT